MTEQPPRLPPPADPALLPVLGAITFVAAVIAYWGFLSLLTDQDVIGYSDAGPLLGPVMVLAAGVVTWLAIWRLRGWTSAGVALVGSLAAMVLIGAVGYTATRGELTWLLLASAEFVTSPFLLGAAALSALVTFGTGALRGRRARSGA